MMASELPLPLHADGERSALLIDVALFSSYVGHMHSKDDLNCTRGYEFWLMKEAKRRNPAVQTWGLAWGAPGWINNQTGFYGEFDCLVLVLECIRTPPTHFLLLWFFRVSHTQTHTHICTPARVHAHTHRLSPSRCRSFACFFPFLPLSLSFFCDISLSFTNLGCMRHYL